MLRVEGFTDCRSHPADARHDVALDEGAVVLVSLRLDLQGVAFQPTPKIRLDRELASMHELPAPSRNPGLVPGCLGFLLGGEPANPARFAHPR